MLRAGRMDDKIVVQRATSSQNSIGENVPSAWPTHKTIWAAVTPVSGKEALSFSRTVTSEVIKLLTYYDDDILVTDRLSYRSKLWNIFYLREIGRGEALEIMAEVHV